MNSKLWLRIAALAGVWALACFQGFGQTKIDLKTQTKSVDFSGASSTKPARSGTALPATCGVGEFYFLTTGIAGQNVFGCTATNVWSLEGGSGGGGGSTLPSVSGAAGRTLSTDGTSVFWQAIAGDVTGSPGSMKVTGLNGKPLSTVTPVDSQLLKFNGFTQLWEPVTMGGDVSGLINGLRVGGLQGRPVSTAIPTDGQLLKFNNTTSMWEPLTLAGDVSGAPGSLKVSGLQGRGVSTGVPVDGQLLKFNGTSSLWEPLTLAGDVSGAPGSLKVSALQGRAVANTAPSNGQALVWNAGSSTWLPATLGTANYSKSFVSLSSWSILGTEHGQGTSNLVIECYDNATPFNELEADNITVDPVSFNVVINFASAQSGHCVVNGNGGGGSGGGGSVSFAQVTGTASTSQLPSGIPTTKIGPGTVTDTALGYLANVTSDVQSQLNQKSAIGHSHIGGGDIANDITAATVVRIQSQPVSAVVPTSGQMLVWSGTQWAPQTVSGSGGASMASQLGDLNVQFTSSTVLTIGGNCTSATPCNVRFGTVTRSISSGTSTTISGGTGAAYVYMTSDGTINVGSNGLTLACASGCVVQTSTTQFPSNSLPIFVWTAANGTWVTGGGQDQRSFLSSKAILAGTGVALLETGATTTVSVDSSVVPTYLSNTATLAFPSIANAACSAELTIPLPGALPGDGVAPGWPALAAGLIGMMRVSANDVAAVRVCNLSGSAVTPASLVYRATVVRGS